MIIKTVISYEPFLMQNIPNTFVARNNFYELFGFDILIDQKLKPWLVEVNVCPSMNVATPIDRKIKTRMMTDLQNLIGYVPFNKKYFEIKHEQQKLKKKHIRKFGKRDNIVDLSWENCVQKLSPEEFNILFEFDEEFHRKGNFIRIFPNKDNVDTYQHLFLQQRFSNFLLR